MKSPSASAATLAPSRAPPGPSGTSTVIAPPPRRSAGRVAACPHGGVPFGPGDDGAAVGVHRDFRSRSFHGRRDRGRHGLRRADGPAVRREVADVDRLCPARGGASPPRHREPAGVIDGGADFGHTDRIGFDRLNAAAQRPVRAVQARLHAEARVQPRQHKVSPAVHRRVEADHFLREPRGEARWVDHGPALPQESPICAKARVIECVHSARRIVVVHREEDDEVSLVVRGDGGKPAAVIQGVINFADRIATRGKDGLPPGQPERRIPLRRWHEQVPTRRRPFDG